MRTRLATSPEQVPRFDTDALRANYLVEDLFATDRVELLYSHEDRLVVGGVAPQGASVALEAPDELRAEFFLQRREAGVVNVGAAPGAVKVDGSEYELAPMDVLYVGRGARDVSFAGTGGAAFYLVSTPAHASHPTRSATLAEATPLSLGRQSTSNERTIYKFVHSEGIQSCQLVLGLTRLAAGSMWNTMPAHTHQRRTEVYLYFGLEPDQRVVHLMGEPRQTRSLIVSDRQAVVGMTRALANEWAPYGVQVNALAPGYIVTENTAALRADPHREPEILGRIPAGRWGTPDDLAGAAVFLAAPASDYVCGQVLTVDGGWLAR